MRYIYVVTYAYDYEGETVKAAYAKRRHARTHPQGGDETVIHRLPVLTKPYRERKHKNK